MVHDVVEGVFIVSLLERVVDPVELAELGIVVLLADHVVASVEVDVRAMSLRVQLPARAGDVYLVVVHEREPVAEVLLLALRPLLLAAVVLRVNGGPRDGSVRIQVDISTPNERDANISIKP
ncbi:hypothetical protein F442_17369 [Phytophthora nicotianae P10297]|uniref:Uncharacterized protein n=2 Tax=Phytophthora nicotianae TaxID=4792 RepID=W2YGV8_PHYNI|nr:hypothetical protein F444_17556 [Phytophthora nicotianae P1976]ETP34265.1 hypothetical protein F442_17369 [Phytophthora nicotianae P10297]